jgi:hypothetical protein
VLADARQIVVGGEHDPHAPQAAIGLAPVAAGRQIGRADGLRRMQMIVFFYFFM